LFWAFGTVRLLVGAASKNRRIVELKGFADGYGASLERHHGSRTSCEEATGPLRERIGALTAQLDDQAKSFRSLAEENETLKATLGAGKQPADSGATS
jgi:hypothetical protein